MKGVDGRACAQDMNDLRKEWKEKDKDKEKKDGGIETEV